MPDRIIHAIVYKPAVAAQAMIEVDGDRSADRIVLIDRTSLALLIVSRASPTGISRFRVPIGYSTNNELLVGIMDDDLVYNAKFADGVQAEIIDGNLVNIRS
ncbi:hypothetical protein AYJ58_06455 [Shewanella sp. Pdp11]|uniref:hypothetical protein n=1 Tax=Shewanella sp. Pdp11 TaxID=2059264 RepID=UPI000CA2BCFC|nr:hypothetical protein [Shewanella sp. Pdp11]AUD59155.1 hypothetical protein AYJ58_06455 [Shewanella sp. Pdp11]